MNETNLGNRLIQIVEMNPVLVRAFKQASALQIDRYYIGAGCITQTVWNYLCGRPLNDGIKDLDFVFFDEDVSYEKEDMIIRRVTETFGDLPYQLDVKNQARVHLWYEKRFGYPIQPYGTLEEAIGFWPTTATSIGLSRSSEGEWKLCAPFGLDDLFALIVRANKAQITKPYYEQKAARWKGKWPALTVIPWE
ncbi:nucleotidyltransferase family protein [Paenibacillus silvisoli]|uniref:nucleotidyltransferase family protein n=1 Tax=Paenibacillus silvisoli TaxID=3110539 RepID=UPI0028043740|nr:nucleotidyltransferase family protein [Paenibacillus silvisoli]